MRLALAGCGLFLIVSERAAKVTKSMKLSPEVIYIGGKFFTLYIKYLLVNGGVSFFDFRF